MKLYYAKGACSLVVRIIINELKLPCQFEAVNLKTKLTENNADFLQINPKGAVPTLDIENQGVLTENAVILQFLADNAQANTLLPPTSDFKRYRILEWLNFISTEIHKTAAWLFNEKIPDEVKQQVIKPHLLNKLRYIESKLNSNKFLAGETFTLPDAYLFVMLTWCLLFKIPLDQYPNLTRYFHELQQRESIMQSLKEEGLLLKV